MDTALGLTLGITGGALAIGLAGFGSAIGIGLAARASAGVLSEDPEKFGSLLILVALPGTQGFYGFLVGFLILMKLGLVTGKIPALTPFQGAEVFFSALPVALTGLVSGIHQGRVSAAGAGLVAKQPGSFMKAVILSALVETYAVLGLLGSILYLNGIKF
ncbi:V-type ATP synthase subunit K [Candidatus Calescamantes bacterium]|nr:V-type ATP synthase subunit K [Candidatus Calescamantes bacterium]HDO71360.1 V-type ATP synthase subunit K [bacterium]HEX68368.1 V-type ATP synthase subunit K [bacterium]